MSARRPGNGDLLSCHVHAPPAGLAQHAGRAIVSEAHRVARVRKTSSVDDDLDLTEILDEQVTSCSSWDVCSLVVDDLAACSARCISQVSVPVTVTSVVAADVLHRAAVH